MSQDLPKITVVTPSFQQGDFIEETLVSVLSQGYPNLEYFVIDGGSTDRTVEVLRRYSSQLTHWVSEPDRGQTHALIKGFDLATGEILCWLNSDDLLEPGTLGFVGEHFQQNHETRFLYGDAVWVDRSNGYIRPKKEHAFNRFIWLYDHNFFPQPSCFWRRELYTEVGGLDEHFQLAMDGDLFIRFADRTRPIHVKQAFSRMRLYPEQKNQRFREQSDREDEEIRLRTVGEESRAGLRAKRVAAKALRVSLKLARGGYMR